MAGRAVPEPATWGLMIAGFGLVGAALRRRRATVLA
ncbi:MAG: PEPxxWA-CTERM sorting domain-containing protein [Sphingomonadaceae bacterium]|nr:PEPxxWA-CTERM sorting domain-containing protein [Sphingomonadaceae bacterium]